MPKYRSRGKKNSDAARTPALVIFLNIVIGILTAAFLAAAINYFRVQTQEREMLYYDDNYIYREVERHQIYDLVEGYYYDHVDLLPVEEAYREAAAIARYANAAVMYRGFALEGETQIAQRWLDVMKGAQEEVSFYRPELDFIDKKAGTAGVTGR